MRTKRDKPGLAWLPASARQIFYHDHALYTGTKDLGMAGGMAGGPLQRLDGKKKKIREGIEAVVPCSLRAEEEKNGCL